ncbi:MAG: DNA-protecting protein DprA [bacterium]|nr:DNA-processing protein DprA [Candidatus Microgenomates bacterium CPR3]MCQ3944690.1 DNA-protecting protein DprA [bacterium]RIK51252.1 MAG: DNA-protecting protein DprA [Candidatus Microgenomates bacterium]
MKVRETRGNDTAFRGRLELVKPPVKKLWCRGELKEEYFAKTVAIVGSRRMSRYGRSVIEEIVPKLCGTGYTIVSGLMYGVDQLAHKKTLESGGLAVGVLGWGIERVNDPESDRLTDEIVAHGGVVLSEYPDDMRGQLWTFPQRNRIVVGLSDIIIVIEAGIKSGTMSTAQWAKKMGKPVYAVPGSMFAKTSEGANLMIETGLAKPLTNAVVEELGGRGNAFEKKRELKALDLDEQALVGFLTVVGPSSVNELARGMGIGVGDLLPVLARLELSGVIAEERGIFAIV